MGEMKRLHDKWNHLPKEVEDTEKARARMSNWVLDLKDQRADMEKELCQVELEIRRKKGELEQLKMEASGPKGPVVNPSVSGQQSQGAAAEPDTPKN